MEFVDRLPERPHRAAAVLEARGVIVEFPGVRALAGADFDLAAGEIHLLLGENGAGKSTFIRVLAGLERPAAGSLRLGGRPYSPASARAAEVAGVATVHQEIDLVPALSVAANLLLGREPTRCGLIRGGEVRRRARAALARVGLALDVDRLLGEFPISVQQLAAIARALDVDARVLVLDEPTSSLDAAETERLFGVLRTLARGGLAVLLITHFLDHVERLADRVTVFRDGARALTTAAAGLCRARLVEAMTGRALAPHEAGRAAAPAPAETEAAPALALEGLARKGMLEPTSLTVAAGSTVGLAGLLGAGRSELLRLAAGAEPPDRGTVRVAGAEVRRGDLAAALRAGLAYCPDDRKRDGLVLDASVRENVALALQARRGALRPIPESTARALAEHWIRRLDIRARSADAPVRELSGGNQQKVLLARWLALEPAVLLLDEPTRGIDVGARAEIERLIRDLAAAGLAVVFASAEIDELARVADRVLVLANRRATIELAGAGVTEDAILAAIAAAPGPGAEPAP